MNNQSPVLQRSPFSINITKTLLHNIFFLGKNLTMEWILVIMWHTHTHKVALFLLWGVVTTKMKSFNILGMFNSHQKVLVLLYFSSFFLFFWGGGCQIFSIEFLLKLPVWGGLMNVKVTFFSSSSVCLLSGFP